jgi:methylphosphotriester-DNA--protein-cysteine methyltransferase
MYFHSKLSKPQLFVKIKNGAINVAGNIQLKIFGKLNCKSGKRMKIENRVFFIDENEANSFGFRPCGNCMRIEYNAWKNEQSI